MKFPNKLFEFRETVIFDCIKILEMLEDEMSVLELYKLCRNKCNGIQEFYDALGILYAMRKIDYDYDNRRILNAKWNNMWKILWKENIVS